MVTLDWCGHVSRQGPAAQRVPECGHQFFGQNTITSLVMAESWQHLQWPPFLGLSSPPTIVAVFLQCTKKNFHLTQHASRY